jgi:hypothetical protein
MNNNKEFNRFKKIIFIILLAFLIVPFGLANVKIAGAIDNVEMERYVDSKDRIMEIVGNSIITLPKLNMLGTDVIASLVVKVDKYSTFVNDYTRDIETEGEALFDDLMEGYQVIRKTVFVAKNINSLTASQQTAYELINTVDNYLDIAISAAPDHGTFESSLDEQRDILDDNFELVEDLTSGIISNVSMESDSYGDDINNLLSLRSQLKEITDIYLNVSSEIVNISEEIIAAENSSTSSDHGN